MYWMQELPSDLNVFQFVASRGEYAMVDELPLSQRGILIFSAKEALYRALYPSVRQILDFDAARVSAFSNSTITLKLPRSWNCNFEKNREFVVRWNIYRDHVFIICGPSVGCKLKCRGL